MPEETNIKKVKFGKPTSVKFKKNKLKLSVTITLKKDVLDPQGKAVQNTLQGMGIDNLKSLRQGKYFEIELNESNESAAKKS